MHLTVCRSSHIRDNSYTFRHYFHATTREIICDDGTIIMPNRVAVVMDVWIETHSQVHKSLFIL